MIASGATRGSRAWALAVVLAACGGEGAHEATQASALAKRPVVATPIGPGGGGSMFAPAVSPHDRRLVFVQSDMGGVYRSADGGASWSLLDMHMFEGGACSTCAQPAFAFHPTDPQTIFAFGRADFGAEGRREALLVSRDAGRRWTPLSADAPWGRAMVTSIAFGACGALYAGSEVGAFVSRDHGAHWAELGVPATRVVAIVTDASAPRRLIVAGDRAVYVSDDDGGTWDARSAGLPDQDVLSASASGRPVVLYVATATSTEHGPLEGGVYRSSDLGRSWVSLMAGLPHEAWTSDPRGYSDIPAFPIVAARPGHPDTAYAVALGTATRPPDDFNLWKTEDAGRSWRATLFGDPLLSVTDPTIVRNADLGWLTHAYDWNWGGSAFGMTASATGTLLYTNYGELYLSEDGGASWRQKYTRLVHAEGPSTEWSWRSRGLDVSVAQHYYVDPFDRRIRYLANTDIALLRSDDGGRSFRQASTGSPWRNSFYALALDPHVPGRAWAAASNRHDLPHSPWIDDAIGPKRFSGGVVTTEDRGGSWSVRGTPLPDAPVTDVALDPRSPIRSRRLWAAVYGRGIFRSDDGGRSWRDVSAAIGTPHNRHFHLVSLHRDGTLFASITGKRERGDLVRGTSGVFRSRDGGDTWQAVAAPGAPGIPTDWITSFSVDPTDSRRIVVGTADLRADGPGSRAGVYVTSDGGVRWRQATLPIVRPPTPTAVDATMVMGVTIHPTRPSLVVAMTERSGTWLSADGGRSFRELHVPTLWGTRAEFLPGEPDAVYLMTFGQGAWRVSLDPP